jgi:hypothetical protein
MSFNIAFVPATGGVAASALRSTSLAFTSKISAHRTLAPLAIRRSTRAVLTPDPKPNRDEKKTAFPHFVQDHNAKINAREMLPKGWNPSAEKFNGRLAQLGFVIGLVTEIFSKDHLTICQQIIYIFSPVSKLFGF